MQKSHKKDLLLIVGVLIIAFISYLMIQKSFQKPANQVVISMNGTVLHHLDLDLDQDFEIDGPQGEKNLLSIKNGQAFITDASCPDKVCIHQGKIKDPGQIIVCLPNAVIVKITE